MGDGQCNLFYFLELVDLVAIPLLFACHVTARPPKKLYMQTRRHNASQTTDAQQLRSSFADD